MSETIWDAFSDSYERRVFSPMKYPDIRSAVLRHGRGPNVLDLGCGPTHYLAFDAIFHYGYNLYSSDFSAKMISSARRRMQPDLTPHFVVADSLRLPFPNSTFDTVFSINSILPENRAEIDPMFSEAIRTITPSGVFVALLPAFEMSLVAVEKWHLPVRIDTETHREFDTTGWQSFYTSNDIATIAAKHRCRIVHLEKLYFDTKDQIKDIQTIYGKEITSETLMREPLFEHLLVLSRT